MKTVYFGKDQQPVTIMQMEHVTMPAWRKAASFDNFRNTVYTLVGAHSVADVMALIANELPIDTGAAFSEAQAAARMVTDSAFNIDNLTLSAFLASEGKHLNFSPAAALADRPEDITFFCFQYDLDGPAADARIQTAGICLRFPQHFYHVKEGKVEEILSSARKLRNMETMEMFIAELDSTYDTPTKKNLFPAENKDASALDPVSVGAATKDAGAALAMQSLSPKMKLMYGKDEKEYKKGYYGPLTFFNTQPISWMQH